MPNEFNEVDARSACEFFTAEARALPTESIVPFRGEPLLVYHNAKVGAAAVIEHQAEIKDLPAIHVEEIKDIPNLALAVLFAARQVNREPESSELQKLYPRVTELRTRFLTFGRALALSGLLPEREMEAIIRGRGKIDNVQDLIQLSALFDRNWDAIAGKHAITREEVKEAAELGTRVLTILKPSSAPGNAPLSKELIAAVDLRDRLWTLLVKRYDEQLWRAGAWLFKGEVDEHVPPLLSRKVKPRKEEPTPA